MTAVVTRQYQFPPAGLTDPPAEECSTDQLLAIAAGACRSPSDLGILQGSPAHLRCICVLLDALHKHVAEQEIQLGELRQRISAAGRMSSGARDQLAVVRQSLGVEIEAHRTTKQQLDREHELRVAAEEELARVAQGHVRDRERLARALRLLSISLDRTVGSVNMLLDLSGGEGGDDGATCLPAPVVVSDPDVCNEQTLVDAPDARCLADVDG